MPRLDLEPFARDVREWMLPLPQKLNNLETLSTVLESLKNYLTGCLAIAKAPAAEWLIFCYPFSTVPAIRVTSYYYRRRSVT
jgi:hypothetical protein